MTAWTIETDQRPLPEWFSRTLTPASGPLRKAKEGLDVLYVQTALHAPLTARYDEATMQRVRGVQQQVGLPITGLVDARTARAIDWLTLPKENDG